MMAMMMVDTKMTDDLEEVKQSVDEEAKEEEAGRGEMATGLNQGIKKRDRTMKRTKEIVV